MGPTGTTSEEKVLYRWFWGREVGGEGGVSSPLTPCSLVLSFWKIMPSYNNNFFPSAKEENELILLLKTKIRHRGKAQWYFISSHENAWSKRSSTVPPISNAVEVGDSLESPGLFTCKPCVCCGSTTYTRFACELPPVFLCIVWVHFLLLEFSCNHHLAGGGLGLILGRRLRMALCPLAYGNSLWCP